MGPDGRKVRKKKVRLNISPQRLGRVASDLVGLPITGETNNPFGNSDRPSKKVPRRRSPILTANCAPVPPESDSSSSSSSYSDSSSDSEEEMSDPAFSSRTYPLVASSARYWRSLDPPLEKLTHLDPADLRVGPDGRLVFAPHADPSFDPMRNIPLAPDEDILSRKTSKPFEKMRWDMIAMKGGPGSIPYAWRRPAGMNRKIEEREARKKAGLKSVGFAAAKRRAEREERERVEKKKAEEEKEKERKEKEKVKRGGRRRVVSEEL